MKWFKFYGQDWITDPKIASMSMEDKLCLIALLTIASSEDKDGFIPTLTEEALISIAGIPDWPESDYNPMERAVGVIERYKALQIVTLDCNGGVTVCNFKKRQGENLTNAERQKKYRIKLKTNKKQRNDSNIGVTTPVTLDKNRIDKNRIIKNTKYIADKPSAHSEIIKFYYELVKSKFGFSPKIDAADGKLLKSALSMGSEELKALILWYLDSDKCRELENVSLSSCLSKDSINKWRLAGNKPKQVPFMKF